MLQNVQSVCRPSRYLHNHQRKVHQQCTVYHSQVRSITSAAQSSASAPGRTAVSAPLCSARTTWGWSWSPGAACSGPRGRRLSRPTAAPAPPGVSAMALATTRAMREFLTPDGWVILDVLQHFCSFWFHFGQGFWILGFSQKLLDQDVVAPEIVHFPVVTDEVKKSSVKIANRSLHTVGSARN